MKASTTICRLVLSFLSQFFQSRRQPARRDRSRPSLRQHHEGVQFVAFHYFHRTPNRPCTAVAKDFPV